MNTNRAINRIVEGYKKEGLIPMKVKNFADIIIVCPKQKLIKFIKVKNLKRYRDDIRKLEKFKNLSDEYMCKFEVWSL